jgi:alanine racemase
MSLDKSAASRSAQGPVLSVDLSAVAANTRLFADRAAGELMAVVKADGFGHEAAAAARTALAHGATRLGVTTIEEAVALRRAGIRAPILSWLNSVAADFTLASHEGVDLAVPSDDHLVAIAAAARDTGRRVDVHLHIDVGMARDGAEPSAWAALCALARHFERETLVRVVGVMGHLGCADDPGDISNMSGRRVFEEAVAVARARELRPSIRHLAATAATLTDRRTHFDLCRVGAGLFGIDPSGTTRLSSALTLTAPVVSARDVSEGTSVGYGHTYVTSQPTRLVLLPLGYADGIPRGASGAASVLIRGFRRPLAGIVSMDQTVVDVGSDHVEVGEQAMVFGPGLHGEPTTAEWARWASTIEHEIVTGLGNRIHRTIVDVGQTSKTGPRRPEAQATAARAEGVIAS